MIQIKKCHLGVVLLLGLGTADIFAIQITVDANQSYVHSWVNNRTGADSQDHVTVSSLDFIYSTEASAQNSSASADWFYLNGSGTASFGSSSSVHLGENGYAVYNNSAVRFTLSESVSYEFTGQFAGMSEEPEDVKLRGFIRDLDNLSYVYYDVNSATSDNFDLNLSAAGSHYGASTGTLEPGEYLMFIQSSFALDQELGNPPSLTGNGEFSLVLNGLPGRLSTIPDSGSSIALLGLGLLGLADLRKRLRR